MRSLRSDSAVDQPLSEEDIQEVERQLKVQLPLGYRCFLARYNAYRTLAAFPRKDNPTNSRPVSQWLGFTPGAVDTAAYRQVQWEDGTTPKECMGFASGFTDSPFCLVVHGEFTGEVRYLDYEQWSFEKPDDPTELPVLEDLPLIASSFEQFFFALQRMPEW